eukprot:6213456-Pleurochrysis_carterae.AAC.4
MRATSYAAVYMFEHCSKLTVVCCVHCRSRGVMKCSERMEGAQALARALESSLRVNRVLCARRKWAHQVHTCTEICPSSCHECTRCSDGHMRLRREVP